MPGDDADKFVEAVEEIEGVTDLARRSTRSRSRSGSSSPPAAEASLAGEGLHGLSAPMTVLDGAWACRLLFRSVAVRWSAGLAVARVSPLLTPA